MEDNKVIQRSFGLPKYILDKIQQDADKRYVSTSVVVREILMAYYKEKENYNIEKALDDFAEDLIESFNNYENETLNIEELIKIRLKEYLKWH